MKDMQNSSSIGVRRIQHENRGGTSETRMKGINDRDYGIYTRKRRALLQIVTTYVHIHTYTYIYIHSFKEALHENRILRPTRY